MAKVTTDEIIDVCYRLLRNLEDKGYFMDEELLELQTLEYGATRADAVAMYNKLSNYEDQANGYY